ncbi:1075_t:CDS:2, partial [Acaulospora colombiana]
MCSTGLEAMEASGELIFELEGWQQATPPSILTSHCKFGYGSSGKVIPSRYNLFVYQVVHKPTHNTASPNSTHAMSESLAAQIRVEQGAIDGGSIT